jgi:hypothetical protein
MCLELRVVTLSNKRKHYRVDSVSEEDPLSPFFIGDIPINNSLVFIII